jgi:beta-phosphoglucomutase-like phosphatase (HAD superfamily)
LNSLKPKPDRDFRAVIFDMDGVIVDSEPRHERAFHAVLHEIGFAENHGLRFADYVGRRDHELWIDFIARNQPPHSLEELLAMKRTHTIELLRREQPIFDGLIPLVEGLATRVPLAVASGSEKPVVEAVLELRGLRRWFRVVVTGSDITRGKPEPDILLGD